MKNNIETIIKACAKQESIPQGHDERFLEKLKQREKKEVKQKPLKRIKRKTMTIIMSTAAVVLVMIALYNPIDLVKSSVDCDEVCEFINYSDMSIHSLQSELITAAKITLLPEEFVELQEDLISMIEDYNISKEQQNKMSEDEFLGFMYKVYQQQVESIKYISAAIN